MYRLWKTIDVLYILRERYTNDKTATGGIIIIIIKRFYYANR